MLNLGEYVPSLVTRVLIREKSFCSVSESENSIQISVPPLLLSGWKEFYPRESISRAEEQRNSRPPSLVKGPDKLDLRDSQKGSWVRCSLVTILA